MDEIKELHGHEVCEKIPIERFWQCTGKGPVNVKWLDMNKGDDVNHEDRSRLIAKEIKRDNQRDSFAVTLPLEAKKLFFRSPATE